MNIVTIIQARTSSSRLPNKVLLPLNGAPLLVRMAERVRLSGQAGTVVIATSAEANDDIIEKVCLENNFPCFRGHLTDLLDRHYKAGLKFKADAVVKIPSDCPLIDPSVISKVISYYVNNQYRFDYVSNLHPATYPDGNDVEVMSMHALQIAWKNAARSLEREHTTPYIWDNPHLFAIGNVIWEKGVNYSTSHRWTIDYEEDYLFINEIYKKLYPTNPQFGMEDILSLLNSNPELSKLNQKFTGKYWYENHLNELTHIQEYKDWVDTVNRQ